MKGITGKILVVDLTSKQFIEEMPPDEIYRQYLGGYGLGVWYIYKHIKPGCDPLGPDNILGFTPGLFTGSGAPFTGRYMVCGKSPLTGKGKRSNGEYCNGGWGNANSGGFFGPAIKRAGYDAIFFKGVSETPVYLLIKDGKVSLEDATFLWGQDVVETEGHLKEIYGPLAKVSTIGQGGENLSLIAGIANDKGRIAARSGLGAVMGSKKLKAVCLLGNFKVAFADSQAMHRLTKDYFEKMDVYKHNKLIMSMGTKLDYFAPIMRVAKMGLTAAPASMLPVIIGSTYGGAGLGTPMSSIISSETGDSPIKNYAGNAPDHFPFKKSIKLRAKMINNYAKKQYGCFSCPLKCGYLLEYDKLPYKDKETHRPEYETVSAFGSLILNDDMDLLLQANEYLNRIAMDSISAGVTVSYVLEGVERGYFKKDDFICKAYPKGFLPKFGEKEYIMPLLKLMGTREGIGEKLADGVHVASTTYFSNTSDFAITANGSEMGMHDMRVGKAWGMSYIADPTPGRHTAANYDNSALGMPDFFPDLQPLVNNTEHPYEMGSSSTFAVKMHQVMESLGLCMFVYFFGDYHIKEMIKAETGLDMDVNEILAIGGRIQTTRQMFNAREGAIRHETPQRAIGSPPLNNGAGKGKTVDPEAMAQGYYKGMNYGQDGVPTEEALISYGLEELIPDLKLCTGVPERLVNEYLNSSNSTPKKGKKHTPAMGG
jgi:aldehyde:ferredoxin oxidoreductase